MATIQLTVTQRGGSPVANELTFFNESDLINLKASGSGSSFDSPHGPASLVLVAETPAEILLLLGTAVLAATVSDLSVSGTLSLDTVSEYTPAAGVTIDGVLLKDSKVTAVSLIEKGLAADGYGLLTLKSITTSKTMAGGATEVIAVQVPSGAKIVACQLRNDVVVVGAGATTYSAAYSTGSTQAISTGTAFSKNTKVNKFFDANADTDITTGLTDITLTPDAGTLDTGVVTAVVYYYELTILTSVA